MALVVPAVICQTQSQVIPDVAWERASEAVYATLLQNAAPALGQSRVVILEADERTIETYGWPIKRDIHIKVIERLKAYGHPWILSNFQFQALTKADDTPGESTPDMEAALASTIKSYGRYVGTGLVMDKDSKGLDADVEDRLLPRILLSSQGLTIDDLPNLQLRVKEDTRIVESQAAFGTGVGLGAEPVIYCGQMYNADTDLSGKVVLPSGLSEVSRRSASGEFLASSR